MFNTSASTAQATTLQGTSVNVVADQNLVSVGSQFKGTESVNVEGKDTSAFYAATNTTIYSREFNQAAGQAKRAANKGPVFITDRGQPAHVLMSIEDYQRLTKQRRNIADALAMPGLADIAFEPPRVTIDSRPVDFS
jgi:prevent-host-death family protein